MKTLSIIILIVFTRIISFSQSYELPVFPIDSLSGKISYKEVVYLDSTLQQQVLFKVAREWFAKSFVSANNVLQMEDEEAGILIGKGSFKIIHTIYGTPFPIRFTISMYFKNGRYKYELTDFQFPDGDTCDFYLDIVTGKTKNKGYSKRQLTNYLNQVHNSTQALLNNIEATMRNVKISNTDW